MEGEGSITRYRLSVEGLAMCRIAVLVILEVRVFHLSGRLEP